MSDLFLETERGRVALSDDMVNKYHLKKGMISPFSNCKVIDGNGNGTREWERAKIESTEERQTVTTAEVLDIAHGADS